MIPNHVINAFNIREPITELLGGSQSVYKSGSIIVKRIYDDSGHSERSISLALWLAEITNSIPLDEFRISQSIQTVNGQWIHDGWMAWSYLDGETATQNNIPEIIKSIQNMHYALKDISKHPLLDKNDTAWGYAHYYCFNSMPNDVHPKLEELVSKLYEKRKPIPDLKCQLIHGDLNLSNIIIAPDKPVGFIDFTPYWAPADFALAMFANWVGPRVGNLDVLKHFQNIKHFEQLIIRAAIRMLLIVSHLKGIDRCDTKMKAAELVLSYVQ